MMTEDEIADFGLELEDKGLSHSEIDVILSHHGVKGMRWGVRRQQKAVSAAKARKAKGPDRFGNRNNKKEQRRADRISRIAGGKASKTDIAQALLTNIKYEHIVKEGFSIKGAAASQLDSAQRLQSKIAKGKKRNTDVLLRVGGIDVREINYKYKK